MFVISNMQFKKPGEKAELSRSAKALGERYDFGVMIKQIRKRSFRKCFSTCGRFGFVGKVTN